MSLVHEALRKAEREKQRKVGAVTGAPVSPQPPATPQPIFAPAVHPPVAAAPVAPVPRETVAHQPAPAAEPSPETNHFLLPALIGCVAMVAIIAIVFLVSNASSVLRQSKENLPLAAAVAVPAPVAKSPVTAGSPTPAQPPAQPPADSAMPPNTPPTTPATDDSKYKISGIMKDPDGKYVAVLNGRVAYEGYYIDGATVKRIEHDRVALDINGRELVVRLF